MDQVEIDINEIIGELSPLGLALFNEAHQKVVNQKLREEIARLTNDQGTESE